MRARLRVVNLTAWRTDDLRAFLRTGLAAIGARPDKVVTVKYGRGRRLGQAEIGGHGYTEARRIALFLPRPPAAFDPLLYAKTLAHECAHNFGLRHDSIAGGCNVHGVADEEVAWAQGLVVRVKDAAPVLSLDVRRDALIEARRKKAERMAEKWERKVNVAARTLSKWKRKVAYYAKREAAGNGTPPAPVPAGGRKGGAS